MFLRVGWQLFKMVMILNQIGVIYVNLCLIECFTTKLMYMVEFCAFGFDWGRNQIFDGGSNGGKLCFPGFVLVIWLNEDELRL